jgi:hypothetical protein
VNDPQAYSTGDEPGRDRLQIAAIPVTRVDVHHSDNVTLTFAC